MFRFSMIGAGNMAGAILEGILKAGKLSPEEIGFFDVAQERKDIFAAKGLHAFSDTVELCRESQTILLAVKPQILPGVLEELTAVYTPDKLVVSIAAGISEAYIKSVLGPQAKIILVMPNTPLLLGCGATAVSRCESVSELEFSFVRGLFEGAGIVCEIPSTKMNEIIAVSGSTPAYIYLMTKYFCEYAERHGIPMETANRLFCQTLIGSARMMTESGMSHQQLINMVTSPKGTTLMGLEALEQDHFEAVISHCCDATVKRAYELGK